MSASLRAAHALLLARHGPPRRRRRVGLREVVLQAVATGCLLLGPLLIAVGLEHVYRWGGL